MAKIDLLAIAVFFVSLILAANAAEENAGESISESYNTTNGILNETSNLSYSDGTAADDSYGLNDAENVMEDKPIEANSSENASQNNLSDVDEAKISNNTIQSNDTPQTDNIVLSDALTAESKNVSIEENQNPANEIAAEVSEDLTVDILTNAADYEEESAVGVTAGFGVYLEIVG